MKYLLSMLLMLFSMAASAGMTDAQLQALAAAIRADTDTAVVSALAVRNDTAIAQNYAQDSATWVWRTSVSQDEIM